MVKNPVITSAGLVKVGRHFGKGLRDLAAEAALQVVDEAGVEPDYLIVSSALSGVLCHQERLAEIIAQHLGLKRVPAVRIEAGYLSGAAAVAMACSLVKSGVARHVLVVGVEKATDLPSAQLNRALLALRDADYEAPSGVTEEGLAGCLMKLYMEEHGVKREELAVWPVLMHDHASWNPYAQLKFKVAPEQVLSSPVIADPLRLLDVYPVGDGAAAVLVSSPEGMEKNGAAAEIAGVAQVTSEAEALEPVFKATREAASTIYSALGIDASKVGVAEIMDTYTITGLLALEALGFAKPGKAALALAEGSIKALVNPSGGCKARGHPFGATGVYQVAEVYMQLTGSFPGLKAENPELGLVHAISGLDSQALVMILRRAW